MELVDTEIENCSCAFELILRISKMDIKNNVLVNAKRFME
jgi:hypothetical protein